MSEGEFLNYLIKTIIPIIAIVTPMIKLNTTMIRLSDQIEALRQQTAIHDEKLNRGADIMHNHEIRIVRLEEREKDDRRT